MENENKRARPGSAFRKLGVAAALLLTAASLSACVVADRNDRGGWRKHHHWNNDKDETWNGRPYKPGWGHGGGSWNGHR